MSTALDTDTSTLEGLDFSADLPCEAQVHGAYTCQVKAVWIQRSTCCGLTMMVCDNKRQFHIAKRLFRCSESAGGCGSDNPIEMLKFDPIPEVWHAA